MNYELAKQLKDAGFPIKEANVENQKVIAKSSFVQFDGKVWYTPTLSELIEACGNVILFFSDGDTTRAKGWYCAYGELGVDERYIAEDSDRPTSHGLTPEEVVAELWLELNKKL